MNIFYGFGDLPKFENAVCTVGSYDGVHVGHRALIRECVLKSKEIAGESVVLTFEPHPRVVLGKAEGLKLLTTLPEKIELLSREGVDNLIVIPFDIAFSRLSYSDFVKEYLISKVNMRCMIVGYNHLFGRNNEGNYALLCELKREYGFDVIRLSEQRNEESKVSSSVVRRLIEAGDMDMAIKHLGGSYLIHNGADPMKLLPAQGIYDACVDGQSERVNITEQGDILTANTTSWERMEVYKKM